MQITRERILQYLQGHPPSSAREISRYLEMTPANIRYHLERLIDDGLVFIAGKRPSGGVGRSILLYTLTSVSLGDNLIPLLQAFLSTLDESENQEQLLELIIGKMTGRIIEGRRNRVQRFNQGVDLLNAMNYHASWEARPQGPQVELRNCPYHNLARTHPILCQLDEKLLQEIYGTRMNLIQKKDFEKDPLSPCIFLTI